MISSTLSLKSGIFLVACHLFVYFSFEQHFLAHNDAA